MQNNMFVKRAVLSLKVFEALCKFYINNGRSPSIKEIRDATGVVSTKQIHEALTRLEAVGLITFGAEPGKRKRKRWPVPTSLPIVLIPVIGYVSGPADFVPGTRYVEITPAGIFYRGRRYAAYVPVN